VNASNLFGREQPQHTLPRSGEKISSTRQRRRVWLSFRSRPSWGGNVCLALGMSKPSDVRCCSLPLRHPSRFYDARLLHPATSYIQYFSFVLILTAGRFSCDIQSTLSQSVASSRTASATDGFHNIAQHFFSHVTSSRAHRSSTRSLLWRTSETGVPLLFPFRLITFVPGLNVVAAKGLLGIEPRARRAWGSVDMWLHSRAGNLGQPSLSSGTKGSSFVTPTALADPLSGSSAYKTRKFGTAPSVRVRRVLAVLPRAHSVTLSASSTRLIRSTDQFLPRSPHFASSAMALANPFMPNKTTTVVLSDLQ
jgi:hypothetical protein